MALRLLFINIFFSLVLFGFLSLFLRLYSFLWLKPEKIRSRLRKQGIRGPPPSFILGNIPEITRIQNSQSKVVKAPSNEPLWHDYASIVFPYFEKWKKEYGSLYMFSLGNLPMLYVTDPYLAKEMGLFRSTVLGKATYLQHELGPLLGQGILTSNGALWSHQRKTIAPELSMAKVTGMVNIMVESTITLVKSWQSRIESVGGIVEIKADEDLGRVSSHIISKVLFGSSFSEGLDIIFKLKTIQAALTLPTILRGIPGSRYIPTKKNRDVWRLEKQVNSKILKIVEERRKATPEQDLLQMIMNGANNGDLGLYSVEKYILDNCKNIYFAGLETSAISASWCLVLLAAHPEWQDRVRAEVVEICKGCLPDADMLQKMKVLTMVILEVLRLYPPTIVLSRWTLEDAKLGDIHVPKDADIWVSVHALHHDPGLWGPDVEKFNPERFTNGITGACKLPQMYIPFGFGQRICAGQNFAMTELKIVLAMILSNFSFSLSPKYCHSPTFQIIIQPKNGVDLLVRML